MNMPSPYVEVDRFGKTSKISWHLASSENNMESQFTTHEDEMRLIKRETRRRAFGDTTQQHSYYHLLAHSNP